MPDAKENFKELYHEVFDENGVVKRCGREKCKALIHAAKMVTTIYGNEETGVMRVEEINLLHNELFKNKE